MARFLQIVFAESAARELRKLDPQLRRRILLKLAEYGDKPELLHADLKQLEDTHDPVQYRIRIGDYRLIASMGENSLQVLHIVHRSRAY